MPGELRWRVVPTDGLQKLEGVGKAYLLEFKSMENVEPLGF